MNEQIANPVRVFIGTAYLISGVLILVSFLDTKLMRKVAFDRTLREVNAYCAGDRAKPFQSDTIFVLCPGQSIELHWLELPPGLAEKLFQAKPKKKREVEL